MPIIADSSQGTTQPIVPIPTKTTTVPTNTVQAIPEASNAINTNQFNFGANIGKIPGVNDKTMAQNPIFQTKEFKEKESLTIEGIKDPIFGESIKNIKSGPYSIDEQVRLIGLAKLQKSKRDSAMSLVGLVGDLLNPSEPIPDDQVDAVYSDLTPEVRNAARGFAADMLNGMPLDEGRKLYPELGKSFFFNKVQDIPYVNQINLDNIKQDISNRTPSDMIPFVEPTFQGNAKDLERTGFLGGFQEVAKFVGNIPSTILNAAIFGTNLMINPESTGKRVGLLPKSLDLSIRQARADTEGLSMPYRMQHLVNNVADFVTENPDIVAGFELGGLIKKGAIRGIGTLIDSIPRPIQDVIMDELKADGILEPTVSQFEAKAQEVYDRQFKKNAETSVDVNVEDGITYTNNRGEVVPAPIINTSQKINDMVFQSLSPTQRGARVKNVRDIQKFAEKMTKGISAVFLNRDNLPDLFESGMLKKDYSMVDLGQAMEDTGDDVWDTAQGMLDEAELQGTKIPTNLIVNYIDQSIADLTRNGGKVIPGFEGVIKYLNDLKNYVGGDDISIYDAQILSKKLNKLTYGGSQSDNLNKRVAEDVNQILRPSIDNELSNMLGQKGLSNFKAIFGAVRELNELVTKLALKDAKQLPMSFWDRVSQGFTANEMMNAGFSIARGDFVGATMSASKAFMAKVVSNFVKADKDRGLILRKLFNEINSQVGDVKIAGGYGTHLVRKMGAVEEMIRGAKKDKSVKLDYTPEATPMMTPEGTINQTIVTAPEAKGGYMQTDITKPGAIKQPLQSNNINEGNRGNEGSRGDGGMNGGIGNDGGAGGAIGEAIPVMKEITGAESNATKGNGQDGLNDGKSKTIEDYLNSGLYDTYEDFDLLENIPRSDIEILRSVDPTLTDSQIVKMYEESRNLKTEFFSELDMTYAKRIRQLNEMEQKIGKVGKNNVNKDYAYKQASKWEKEWNMLRQDMMAEYGLDEAAIFDKIDELDGLDINEPMKAKREYVPAAERKIRREESLQKKLDKARRPATTENPPLYEEARKYKSAEEFVKAQGKPVYHGTNAKFSEFSLKDFGKRDDGFLGVGVYLTASKSNAKQYGNNIIKSFIDIKNPYTFNDVYFFGGLGNGKIAKEFGLPENATAKELTDVLKKQGYDGVIVNEITDTGIKKNAEILVFDPKNIKTESQLKQIREEAQSTVKSTDESLMEEARKYKSAEEFVSDPTIQKKLLDSTKNFKSEYPELPKVKEPEIIQKKIDEYKADYEHYKSKGQDTFAKNAKEYMEEFEAKLEQSKKEWGDFYKNRKIYTDKYGNLSQGEYQLKQIREEANQSRRKDLPTN